jgi:hypothetical protein
MIKDILEAIQKKIEEAETKFFVDEDWAQLDVDAINPPVKFPCVLIDVSDIGFSNIGQDRTQTPRQRQNGLLTIRLTVAAKKLSNTSGKAPQSQKDNAWKIYGYLEEIHKLLHGWCPVPQKSGKLERRSFNGISNQSGVQQKTVDYNLGVVNV